MQAKEQKEGIIRFKDYRLFSLNYRCEPNYKAKSDPESRLMFNFSYGVADLASGDVQVNFLVQVYYGKESTDIEQSPFSVSVEIGGKFNAADGMKWDHRWDANAIAIMYPYARAIISSITAQAGVDTVILPTVNVAAMLMNNDAVAPDPE